MEPDFIPFVYSLGFTATSVEVIDGIEMLSTPDEDGGESSKSFTGKPFHTIRATLTLDAPFHAQKKWPKPKLSMLGSARDIHDVRLEISPLADAEASRRLEAWGAPIREV